MHDASTEVLTDTGWSLFVDLTGAERLASVDPVTSKLIYEKPRQIKKSPFKGNLIVGKQGHSIDFKIIPEHNMLVRKWDESARTLSIRHEFIKAQELGWYTGLMNRVTWEGEGGDTYKILGVFDHKHLPQRSIKIIPMGLWLQFMGIYLAEGTIVKSNDFHYKIQFAATKDREKSYIKKILFGMGINSLELSDRITFDNRQLYEELVRLGLKGVYASEKFVPSFVFKQNAENIKLFLLGHFMGDGCVQYNHRSHYTSSSKLANDLQRLIFLSGNESHISIRGPRTSFMTDGRKVVGRHPEHRVSVCECKNLSIERGKSITHELFEGLIFSAEVPTHHTLVTRRNRHILISGE